MSMANRRSWEKQSIGRLHWTVEAEPTDLDRNLDRHRGLARVTEQLFELFNRHQLPATWAVGDPARSAAAGLVTASKVEHDLAVLGDRHWIGNTAGRTRFARELARRVVQARTAGIQVATLAPRVASVTEHIDLIVKHGIRAVVSPHCDAGKSTAISPQPLHYGVWEFAATTRLPLRSSWLPGSNWKLARRIRHSLAQAGTVHLVVDASAIERAGESALQGIDQLMRHVEKLREQGHVIVETLGAAATRMLDLPTARPQKSILRAA